MIASELTEETIREPGGGESSRAAFGSHGSFAEQRKEREVLDLV